jgi:hypothetical protein
MSSFDVFHSKFHFLSLLRLIWSAFWLAKKDSYFIKQNLHLLKWYQSRVRLEAGYKLLKFDFWVNFWIKLQTCIRLSGYIKLAPVIFRISFKEFDESIGSIDSRLDNDYVNFRFDSPIRHYKFRLIHTKIRRCAGCREKWCLRAKNDVVFVWVGKPYSMNRRFRIELYH